MAGGHPYVPVTRNESYNYEVGEDAVEGAAVHSFVMLDCIYSHYMWWKIILEVIGIVAVGFVGMVVKMAITEAKEEMRDIDEADKTL